MLGEHRYEVELEWQGDRGEGTSGYRAYGRQHVVRAAGKLHEIAGSSDRVFHGDRDRWNPEELLLDRAQPVPHALVPARRDQSRGDRARVHRQRGRTMLEDGRGGGAFTEVTLHPVVTVADASMLALADELHAEAAEKCFIAASVAFPVRHEPTSVVAG